MPEIVQAETAYIGLGSNMGDRAAYLRAAVRALDTLTEISLVRVSSIYLSPAVGPGCQGDYYNAAAACRTALPPRALLGQLMRIENNHGRQRSIHWGPRTLDLDLLLYGEHRINAPDLQLPHPHLLVRDFVLAPLCEIAPDLRHPDGEKLSQSLAGLPQTCKKLAPF